MTTNKYWQSWHRILYCRHSQQRERGDKNNDNKRAAAGSGKNSCNIQSYFWNRKDNDACIFNCNQRQRIGRRTGSTAAGETDFGGISGEVGGERKC